MAQAKVRARAAGRGPLRSFGSVADRVALFNKVAEKSAPTRGDFSKLRTAKSMEQLRLSCGEDIQATSPTSPTSTNTNYPFQRICSATSQPDLAPLPESKAESSHRKHAVPPVVKRKPNTQGLKRCQSTPEHIGREPVCDMKPETSHEEDTGQSTTTEDTLRTLKKSSENDRSAPREGIKMTYSTRTSNSRLSQTPSGSTQTDGPHRTQGQTSTSSIAIVAPVTRIPQKVPPSPVHKKVSRVNSRDSGYLDDGSENSSVNGSPERTSLLSDTDSVFVSPTKYRSRRTGYSTQNQTTSYQAPAIPQSPIGNGMKLKHQHLAPPGQSQSSAELQRLRYERQQLQSVLEKTETELFDVEEERDNALVNYKNKAEELVALKASHQRDQENWTNMRQSLVAEVEQTLPAVEAASEADLRILVSDLLEHFLEALQDGKWGGASKRRCQIDTRASVQESENGRSDPLKEEVRKLEEENSHIRKELRILKQKAAKSSSAEEQLVLLRESLQSEQERCMALNEAKVRLSQRYEAQQQTVSALEAEAEHFRSEASIAEAARKEACSKHSEELSALSHALDMVEEEKERRRKEYQGQLEKLQCQHSLELRAKDLQIKQLEEETDGLTRTVTTQEKRLSSFSEKEQEIENLASQRQSLQEELEEAKKKIHSFQNSLTVPVTERSSNSAPSSPQARRSGVFVAKVSPTQASNNDTVSPLPAVNVRPQSERSARTRNRHSYASSSSGTSKPPGMHRFASGSHIISGNSAGETSTSSSSLAQRRYGRYLSDTNIDADSQSSAMKRWQTVTHAVQFTSALQRSGKKDMLLRWCQQRLQHYDGVAISNFHRSWSDGLAFCALLHSYMPEKVSFDTLDKANKAENLELAFSVAADLGITRLLDVEDMVTMEQPEWRSVMTYVSSIYNHFNPINNTK